MRNTIYIVFILIGISGCNDAKNNDANTIINKSISVSGGSLIGDSEITFDFRDRTYTAIRNKGKFKFSRLTTNETDSIFDVLSNKGFERFINNERVKVSDSMIPRYSSSINSVHYFSVLPYGLNNAAVNKIYIGNTIINHSKYHKIKVTFNEEGGGVDYEDVFVYWLNSETFKVDYLAYSYQESDGIGYRFREAYNERYIEGIRFVDYNNYKPKSNTIVLEQLDRLFVNNDLKLLSKIELKKINVKQIKKLE